MEKKRASFMNDAIDANLHLAKWTLSHLALWYGSEIAIWLLPAVKSSCRFDKWLAPIFEPFENQWWWPFQKFLLTSKQAIICLARYTLATLQICEKTTPPPNFKPQTDDLLMLQNCTNLILTTRCKNDNKIFKNQFFNNKCI